MVFYAWSICTEGEDFQVTKWHLSRDKKVISKNLIKSGTARSKQWFTEQSLSGESFASLQRA